MNRYLELMKEVLETGEEKQDRTGTGTLSLFGRQLRFSLDRFPLLTTKKVHLKSIVHELLWFLQGDTNISYLKDNKVRIWDEWADDQGNLGRVYGAQWRSWQKPNGETVDQIKNVVESIKNSPNSRRHLVVAFNPGELDQMALPPCHAFFQFYVSEKGLSCQLYQRSADIFLGVPFNIASYALLTMMMAQVCGLPAHEFVHTYGDVHLYKNHVEQAKLQLSRTPKTLPRMLVNPNIKNILDFTYDDFELVEYEPHPRIAALVSI